jgi:hypothetical protein
MRHERRLTAAERESPQRRIRRHAIGIRTQEFSFDIAAVRKNSSANQKSQDKDKCEAHLSE